MEFSKLIQIMRQHGIVGAGGAGFPAYAKLDQRADTLILNCAECEPLLKLHRQVLREYAREILSALDIMAKAVEAQHVIVGIKPSYRTTIDALQAYLPTFPGIQLGFLPETYPAGDEVVLIYELTKRQVAPGSIPITVGVTVFNVETVLNVYRALHENLPVVDKYVTVAGEVSRPVTLKVPVGIPVHELVNDAGGATVEDPVYIEGGPMTGQIISPYHTVSKTTNAVLVFPKNHSLISRRTTDTAIDMKRAMGTCCQCRMCTDLCPRYLLGHPIEPHAFMHAATSGSTKELEPLLNTMFCSQCGLCEMYACSQGLSPRTLIGIYKDGLRKKGIQVPKNIEPTPVNANQNLRGVPKARLTARLGLTKYDVPARLQEKEFLTKSVRIALRQSIGSPARPVVKAGDHVCRGQLIAAEDKTKLGVPLHASIDGNVTEVNDQYITIKANGF